MSIDNSYWFSAQVAEHISDNRSFIAAPYKYGCTPTLGAVRVLFSWGQFKTIKFVVPDAASAEAVAKEIRSAVSAYEADYYKRKLGQITGQENT